MQTKKQGFTLIEVVIVLGITAVIIAGMYTFLIESYSTQRYISEQSEAINNARNGVEALVLEIREAADADTGAYPIETAEEQELIFYSDIDADVLTERIRYFLDGTNLQKGIIEPLTVPPYTYEPSNEVISTITSSVQNDTVPIFTYYNGNYLTEDEAEGENPLSYPADVTDIKLIKIFLEVNIDPTKVPETYELENYVQIRNLKDNL